MATTKRITDIETSVVDITDTIGRVQRDLDEIQIKLQQSDSRTLSQVQIVDEKINNKFDEMGDRLNDVESQLGNKLEALESQVSDLSKLIVTLTSTLRGAIALGMTDPPPQVHLPPALAPAMINEFHDSNKIFQGIVKDNVGGEINGEWQLDHPRFNNKNGFPIEFRGNCSRYFINGESTFATHEVNERRKIQVPELPKPYAKGADYLEFAFLLVEYLNMGGNLPFSQWTKKDVGKFNTLCGSLGISENQRGLVSIREMVVLILYYHYSPIKEHIMEETLSKCKLNCFRERIVSDFLKWKEDVSKILDGYPYVDAIVETVIPKCIHDDFIDIKTAMRIKKFENYGQLFDWLESQMMIFQQFCDQFPSHGRKSQKEGKINAASTPEKIKMDLTDTIPATNAITEEKMPYEGWECRLCDKKFAKTITDSSTQMSHGYPFKLDGSGNCKCPIGAKNPQAMAKYKEDLISFNKKKKDNRKVKFGRSPGKAPGEA
jgi:hypothetical protein